MNAEKLDKPPASPLWELMVEKYRWSSDESTIKRTQNSVEGLLRSGYNVNETWHHASWTNRGPRSFGIVSANSVTAADFEYCSSPLFCTILDNNINLATLLLQYGANTEQRTQQGMTALHLAVKLMRRDMVKLLIGYGANLEAKTIDPELDLRWGVSTALTGRFALHHAVLSARLDILQDLIELGANAEVVTTAGWSILDIAILYQRVDIIEYLSKEYPSLSAPFTDKPLDHPMNKDAAQIARQLLISGTQNATKQYREVFLNCMRQAWNRIESGTDSTGGTGRMIVREAETALMITAGLDDQLSWDPGFCEKCLRMMGQEAQSLSELFEHSPDMSCLRQSAVLGCPLCQILSETLQRKSTKEHPTEGWSVQLKVKFPEYTGSFKGDDLGAIIVQCNKTTSEIDLGLVDEQTRTAIFGTSPSDVHGSHSARTFAVAKAWLDHCELHHQKCRIELLPTLPTRVVAVGNERREPYLYCSTNTRARYTVLSYCWGGFEGLETKKANLHRHLSAIPFREIPKTIQDAIVITRELGIEFLWVDSFCIVQDSAEDFKQQVSIMGDIYANATLTIAAKDAHNATAGCLSNIKRKSTAILPLNFLFPRGPGREPHRSPRINRALLIPKLDVPSDDVKEAVLDLRGWTLQEQLLSRRILNCWKRELSWSCLERKCSESQPRTETVFATRQNDNAFSTRCALANVSCRKHTPSESDKLFDTWLKIVEDYSTRQLSDPRDKVVALAGVQSKYADILSDTPFLGGWRQDYLWPSLLWYCQDGQLVTKQENPFPSWAWPSVNCPVKFITYSLARWIRFDPVVRAWNLSIMEEDVRISGSISIQCRILPPSVLRVVKEGFDCMAELEMPLLYAYRLRVFNAAMRKYEAEKTGDPIKNKPTDEATMGSSDYYHMLVASPPESEPQQDGYLTNAEKFPGPSLFMVLERICPDQMHFRKVALYHEFEDESWREKLQDVRIELF